MLFVAVSGQALAEQAEDILGFRLGPAFFLPMPGQIQQNRKRAGAGATELGDTGVVEHGHVIEQPQVLKCACHPGPGHLVGLGTGDIPAV